MSHPTIAIPCYRCGAPVARNVAELLAAMADGSVTATKAYYVHGSEESGYTCGNVIAPGGDKAPAVHVPFRKAVKGAMTRALAAEGYVRIMHVPAPVRQGSPEEGEARVKSEAVQARLTRKGKSADKPTAMAAGCMFYMAADGTWTEGVKPATAPAPVAPVAPVGAPPVAPPPAPPAPPAPPVAGPVAPPPPPPAPRVHVALTDGTVAHVTVPEARAMMADGRAYSVCVNGAWSATLP